MSEHAAAAGLYESPVHRRETGILGMWVFLVTELMFFGGVFAAFFVYYFLYPEAWREASNHLSVMWGGINTGVLLLSSYFVAMAVDAAQQGKRSVVNAYLLGTILLAFVFLSIKGIEYHEKFAHHLWPGAGFAATGPHAEQVRLFMGFYFAMTGLHALHIIIGIGVLAWVVVLSARGRFSSEYYAPVEVGGLYWHLVDLIWIFLFPLLYLLGRSHH